MHSSNLAYILAVLTACNAAVIPRAPVEDTYKIISDSPYRGPMKEVADVKRDVFENAYKVISDGPYGGPIQEVEEK